MHRPRLVVFDGVSLYRGLRRAVREAGPRLVWVQRWGQKPDKLDKRRRQERHADQLIVPGELGFEQPENDAGRFFCPPILLLDESELLGRAEARRVLWIPEGRQVLYLQLGAGNIDNIGSKIDVLLRALARHPEVFVVAAESAIGARLGIQSDQVRVIADYPNVRFARAFDMAVVAAGYNTVHELVWARVPALFLPNRHTAADDQVSRARRACEIGAALIAESDAPESLASGLERPLDGAARERMRAAAGTVEWGDGAHTAAKSLARLLER